MCPVPSRCRKSRRCRQPSGLVYPRTTGWLEVHDQARPRLLVIEDDRDLRQLYVHALEDAGFTVVQAHNGLQALEKATELRRDAIVTDLGLPGIDGYEICRRLRRDGLSQVPIVAITGPYFTSHPRTFSAR
jgi:CheY-like chemotaxis protein